MKKSGFYFIEGMPGPTLNEAGERVPPAKPGNEEPERWEPYKLWTGDLWECQGCGARILSGFGREPIAEHYQPDFAQHVANLNADQLQVNDC